MKKENRSRLFPLWNKWLTKAAIGLVTLVAFALLSGCDNLFDSGGGGGGRNDGFSTLRYEVVRYGSLGRNTVGGSENFRLVDSGRAYDDSAWYFIYYLGFIRSMPTAFRTSYRFDGITPITISYGRNWGEEETISHAKTEAKERTWNTSAAITAGVTLSASGGFAPFAKASVAVSVSSTFTAGFGGTVSTSNTFETARTTIEGGSESIEVTIGNNRERPGRYRFALMGTSDVFLMVRVDPDTYAILSQEIIHSARTESFAWGIEFTPDDLFERTGGGGEFFPPNFTFSAADRPSAQFDAPPVLCEDCGGILPDCACPPPTHERVDLTLTTGRFMGGATNVQGDNNVNTSNNRATDWEFQVTNMRLAGPRNDGTYSRVEVDVVYDVQEVWSDFTRLRVERTHIFDLGERRAESLVEGTTTGHLVGRIAGQNHDWNHILPTSGTPSFGRPQNEAANIRTFPNVNRVSHHGSPNAAQLEAMNRNPPIAWTEGAIQGLVLRIDGSGNDLGNIGYNATIMVSFIERLSDD